MAINIKRWLFPFAVAGDKTPIPEAVDPAGAVSYPQGWGPDYERDPATDPLAKRIPRLESNQAMYDVTATLKDLQEQGLSWFIAAAQNGGVAFPYIKGARVLYDNAGDIGVYESLVDSNTAAPTDASKWVRDVAARFATQSEADAGSSGVVMVAPREMSRAVQSGRWNYATAAGTANALTVTLGPAPTSIPAGMPLRLKIATTNTGPATLNAGPGAVAIQTLKGNPLAKGDLPAGSIVTLIYNGSAWVLASVAYSEIRQVLQSDLTLWIRTDGNDSNDGSANNAANAFATIQGCWNYIVNRFDGAGKTITMALGLAGNYDGFNATAFGGNVVLQGDPASPSDNYLIRCRNGSTISQVITSAISQLNIVNCVLAYSYTGATSVGNEWILAARNGGQINAIGCRYRMIANRLGLIMNSVDSKCVIAVRGATQIQGAFACSHFAQVLGAGVFLGGVAGQAATIALEAGQTYNQYFAQASLGGVMDWSQTTFSGSTNPTAIRYLVSLNGVINTNGGGANFFPGTVAGVSQTGGQYA